MMRDYRRHLRDHMRYVRRMSIICLVVFVLAWLDFVGFIARGTSVLHPALSLVIAVAAACLIIVAGTATLTVRRYMRETEGRE